jgi:hypothetical protein
MTIWTMSQLCTRQAYSCIMMYIYEIPIVISSLLLLNRNSVTTVAFLMVSDTIITLMMFAD